MNFNYLIYKIIMQIKNRPKRKMNNDGLNQKKKNTAL